MKVLCLHGMGTSSKIWESQTAAFRYQLPSDWQWTFVDGEVECEAGQGVEQIYEGPYLTYYTVPTFEAVEDCHTFLDDVIEEEGPFDAVMGFSQGGALAASYMLHHQHEKPDEPPPFTMAIFVNASLPYSKNFNHGVSMASLFSSLGATDRVWKAIVPADDGHSSDSDSDLATPPLNDAEQEEERKATLQQIFRWHPGKDTTRIEVPTVHIFGAQDPYMPQGVLLQELCAERLAISFTHSGGHDVPRAPGVSKAIADAIQRAKARADFMQ